MKTADDKTKVKNNRYDDLTVISGIGLARQNWLREALGVRSFSDLAAFSAGEIEAQLKAEKKPISHATVEGWLHQARELASQIETPAESAEVRDLAEWQPFATFVVEFQHRMAAPEVEEVQITTHYMEKDRTKDLETKESKEWPQLEQEAIFSWMLAQIDQEAPQQAQLIEASQPTVVTPADIRPTSRDMSLRQPPAPSESQRDQDATETEAQQASPPQKPVVARKLEQGNFSDKLEHVLAKVHQLETSRPKHPVTKPGGNRDISQEAEAQLPELSEFSEKLQKVLAKTQ